ncbi:50S ribosomal protein L3 [Thermodesulfovibrio yellowstonii]|uniref:50S ribosomal protein L3 n=1 Tax=Thermodesulfovibrio yellowstonii TaxID=28262 RepID=UPI0004122FC7|nr:50S ribosomal protein L3 [Thermodesulfovibrio islandicus]
MKAILGKKIGMTQIFDEEGRIIPVTVIEAGPCWIVQVRSKEKNGYEAVQLGFQEIKKEKNVPKPLLGIFKKAGIPPCRVLKEFKMAGFNVGDKVTVEIFTKGDVVSIAGISKGKGYQGVMKRHNFAGGPDTHGSMFNRAPGSIGASSFPSRVWKGKGMAGHMGNERVTVKNLTIVDVIPEQNLLLVKGAVPGGENGILQIWKVEA